MRIEVLTEKDVYMAAFITMRGWHYESDAWRKPGVERLETSWPDKTRMSGEFDLEDAYWKEREHE